MVQKTTKENLPQYYAIFIIASLLPQIFGFNGSMFDTIWKLVSVASLILFTKKNFAVFPVYSFIYIVISFLLQLATVAFGNESFSVIVINTAFTVLMIIIFLNYPLQAKHIKIEEILKFHKIFVYFMAISCVYNMILHPSRIFTITSFNIYGTEGICSFFDNKNTFGVFLLFASLAAVILKYYTKQIRWTLLLGLIIINELMAGCRTAIVISTALMVASILISKSGITFKRVIITIFVVIIIAIVFSNVDMLSKMLNNLFFSTNSMDARNNYVTLMKPLIKDVYAIIGYGSETSKQLAYQYTGNQYFHNTYLNIIIAHGIVGFLLFLSVIFISLKTSIKIKKYDKATSSLCILSCIVYLVYAYVESTILFNTPVISMVATIFVVSMPILHLKAVEPQDFKEMDSMG